MASNEMWDRREFTRASVLALLSGVAITVSGCGDDSPTSPSGDEVGVVSANHGHSAVVTEAQLQAGGAVTLNIQGSASHPHTVSLTAQQIVAVAGGQSVSVTSTTDSGHSHTVTFN